MYKILAKTLFLGKQVFYMPTCHSTNEIAMDMVKKPDTREGSIVITHDQTAGKGQRGNSWISEPGSNLTFSLILKPKETLIQDQFQLSVIVSLAVSDVLRSIMPEKKVEVKWPNDIYVAGKKIAGILIENTLTPPFLEYAVVGVGLNVNQSNIGFTKGTSLITLTGKNFDLQELLEKIVLAIERRYLQLKSGDFSDLRTDYLSRLLGYKTIQRFRGEYEFEGAIQGITREGLLEVLVNREIQRFDLKEIVFL